MRRFIVPFLTLSALAAAPVLPAQDAERTAVLATAQKLFDAMRTRDTILLKSVFDSTARLVSVATPRGGGGTETLSLTTPSQFGAAFTRAPAGNVWNERMYDPEVRIDGNVAQVWTYYTFHLNATFNHCGIDAFMMVKVAGAWKITQIADTHRTAGCTHTTPPGG